MPPNNLDGDPLYKAPERVTSSERAAACKARLAAIGDAVKEREDELAEARLLRPVEAADTALFALTGLINNATRQVARDARADAAANERAAAAMRQLAAKTGQRLDAQERVRAGDNAARTLQEDAQRSLRERVAEKNRAQADELVARATDALEELDRAIAAATANASLPLALRQPQSAAVLAEVRADLEARGVTAFHALYRSMLESSGRTSQLEQLEAAARPWLTAIVEGRYAPSRAHAGRRAGVATSEIGKANELLHAFAAGQEAAAGVSAIGFARAVRAQFRGIYRALVGYDWRDPGHSNAAFARRFLSGTLPELDALDPAPVGEWLFRTTPPVLPEWTGHGGETSSFTDGGAR